MVRFQICHCGLWLNWSDVGRTGGARLSGRGLAAAASLRRGARGAARGVGGRRALDGRSACARCTSPVCSSINGYPLFGPGYSIHSQLRDPWLKNRHAFTTRN